GVAVGGVIGFEQEPEGQLGEGAFGEDDEGRAAFEEWRDRLDEQAVEPAERGERDARPGLVPQRREPLHLGLDFLNRSRQWDGYERIGPDDERGGEVVVEEVGEEHLPAPMEG